MTAAKIKRDSATAETEGKAQQDKVQKEDSASHDERTGETGKKTRFQKKVADSEPARPKRGRPKKTAKEHEEEVLDHQEEANGEDLNAEDNKKTKQQKHEHNAGEEINGNDDNHSNSAEEFDEFIQKLQANVSTEEVKILLQENSLETLGSEEQLYQRSADLLFFGTCESCPSCEGVLEFAGQSYRCSGYSTEWAKCNYSTADGRKGGKAKLSSKSKNDFLKKWVKSHHIPVRQYDPSDKPFSGMVFALSGRMSCPQGEIRKDIEKYGGTVVNSVRPGVTALLCADNEAKRGGHSKMEEASEAGLPICRESWLSDSIEKMQAQPLDSYNMAAELPGGASDNIPWDKRSPEEEAAESLIADLKLVGKRVVCKDSELEKDGGKIYEKGDIIYNCAFSVCDILIDLNQYAILQLIEMPSKRGRARAVYLYSKEGRVGDRLSVRARLDLQDSPKAAVKEFEKVFKEFTGNDFLPWEREKKFSKKRNKYFPIDMGPGVDARAGGLGVRQLGVAAVHSKLNSRVVEFLKFFFSQSVYRFAMTEMGVDAPDLPIGNLTDWHIELCKQYLVEFADFLKRGEDNEQKKEQACLDFSNKWFTLLHTTRPFIMNDLTQLSELAAPTLESVRDIAHASRLVIGDMTGDTLDDPIADRYAKLGCQMTPLDREGDDYQMIMTYLSKTMEPLKFSDGDYGLIVEDIVHLESGAGPSLEDIKKIPNRVLLWCGMRTSNWVASLHRGLQPATFDAPAPFYSFGRGVYCTDAACKAAQYGFTAVYRSEGFLMLAIVGLGDDVIELAAPEKAVKDYEDACISVKVLGKKAPASEEHFKWKHDVTVPCGTLRESGVKGVQDFMDFNEYVVYNPKQVKPAFLVKTRFEIIRGTSTGEMLPEEGV